MIEVSLDGDASVTVAGKEIQIIDAGDDYVVAECTLDDLRGESAKHIPCGLNIQVHSEDGFGTYLFYEIHLISSEDDLSLNLVCHRPNKYWDRRYGLATLIQAIRDQAIYSNDFRVENFEIDEDWKGITLSRDIADGSGIADEIVKAASDARRLIDSAEISLAGLTWKAAYERDEKLFCVEVLEPLLRRMKFSFVRYTGGRKEYGKDFTFSELTAFGDFRHYGLQAKAGSVSGNVNSQVDELLGQVDDAFRMPYYELGSKDERYISTFIIAISGEFTENAKEKIVHKVLAGTVGSVYFLDKVRILELVERYWIRD